MVKITVRYLDYEDCFEPFVTQDANRIVIEIPCDGPIHDIPGADPTPQGLGRGGTSKATLPTRELVVDVDPLPFGVYAIEVATNRPLGPANIRRLVASHALTVADERLTILDVETNPPSPTDLDLSVVLEVTTNCAGVLGLPRIAGRTVIVGGHQAPSDGPDSPCVGPPITHRLHLGQLLDGTYSLAILADAESAAEAGLLFALHDFEIERAFQETVQIGDERSFVIGAEWTRPDGMSGTALGRLLPDADDSATFWFFRPGNRELIIKILDGCGENGFYWVFLSGLTNLGTVVTVTDIEGDRTKTYENALDNPFVPRLDTRAFACE